MDAEGDEDGEGEVALLEGLTTVVIDHVTMPDIMGVLRGRSLHLSVSLSLSPSLLSHSL